MDKYEQLSVVGEGSYGLVMKCRHRETDQIVAIKKFLETEEDATIRKMALREIRMLKRLKHENLVTMIEVFRHRKRFYLVFEYLEGTVLDELDKMPGGLGDERSRERIFQVTRAISYCHSNNIIHRDVKPENVLVSSLGVVKLCDFGFARLTCNNGEACTEYVATRWYRAPELLVGELNYGTGVDVWAIGCLFAEMMTGDPLFPGESDIDQLYLIVKMLGKPCARHFQLISRNVQLKSAIRVQLENENHVVGLHNTFSHWPIQAVEFLVCCTKMDPQQRFSADDLLKHSYFTHDRFPQRFLPALREKVNIEFNNPLMRRFKTEILMSTDKKDENKSKRTFHLDSKWKFTLTEGSMKRKLGYENNDANNIITLTKTAQRLAVLSNQPSMPPRQKSNKNLLHTPKLIHDDNVEMQMLEKSLESLAKFKNEDNRPTSGTEPVECSSPAQQFQSLHFGFGDYNKSPISNNHHLVLHPSINNISFSKDPPKKRSPNILQNIHNVKTSQVPLLSTTRSKFNKKFEKNLVVTDNLFGSGDQNGQMWGNTPSWLNGLAAATCNSKKKDGNKRNSKHDDFSLPNLPGATISPSKSKKKSLPEIELPHSTEVTPEYRYRRAKRKRNTLDISLPVPVKQEMK